MVERVSWLSPIDYHILEFFEEHDIQVSPKVVAENIGYERVYTGKRLKFLKERELLQQHENQLYSLSDTGRAFIAGEIDADEFTKPGKE